MSDKELEIKPLADSKQRAITILSIVFGLIGMVFTSGLAGMHDSVCKRPLMIGNHMPGGAFTYIMFVGLIWNGLMCLLARSRKLSFMRRLALNPKELAVVLVMTLVSSFPPTSGFFRYFHRMIILPWYYLSGKPDWVEHSVVECLNPKLFPTPFPFRDDTGSLILDQRVYQGFISGLSSGLKCVPLQDLPLSAWMGCLTYWGPLLFSMSLCVISLQFLVHRQWAHHEQLGYPVAQVAGRFCMRKDGLRGIPDMFRSPLFWWGVIPVLALYALDYTNKWAPSYVPGIADALPCLKSWNVPLVSKLPALKHAFGSSWLNGQSLFFTILGLAYFVSTEISLTMGLAQFILVLFGLVFYQTTGSSLTATQVEYSRVGAYIGYTAVLIYTGRAYFSKVFRKAFSPFREKGKESAAEAAMDDGGMAVLAARALVVSFIAFVAVLVIMGFDWLIALFYALALLMLFLVFTRIICETGIFFMQANWAASKFILAILGPSAVGPAMLSLMLWTNSVLAEDPRECLMPYVATSVKVVDDSGIKLKKIFFLMIGTLILAVGLAYFTTSYSLYNYNGMGDGYASIWAVTTPFDQAAKGVAEIKDLGDFEVSSQAAGFAKLGLIKASPEALKFIIAGIALVALCSTLRFRFSNFPLHPVLFMVWGTYPSSMTWGSFLLGWFIKVLIVKFGGGGVYQKLKNLFAGLITGELLAVGLNIIVNLVYLWINGMPADRSILILPA